MLEDTIKVVCNKCGGSHFDDATGKPDYSCYDCESKDVSVVLYSGLSPEEIMNVVDSELENANYHSIIGVPSKLYNTLEEYVGIGHRGEVARKIADIFYGMV